MNRAKPSKIFLVLAVMMAGAVCLLLPEKKMTPVASMGDVVKDSPSSMDTTLVTLSDSSFAE